MLADEIRSFLIEKISVRPKIASVKSKPCTSWVNVDISILIT